MAISTVISQCEMWVDNEPDISSDAARSSKVYEFDANISTLKVAEELTTYGEE